MCSVNEDTHNEQFVILLSMKTYTGGCHCGNVRYEVDMEELTSALACNCSICSKRGWLLTFVPSLAFRLLAGTDDTTTYHFNSKKIDHIFCKTCGVASYGTGSDGTGNTMVSINVRCLDDIDIDTLTVNHYDGKNV